MGSTNAILKYKYKDIYDHHSIIEGKYNEEIIEIENIHYGKIRAIYPNRPFCFMVGYSALEGNEKAYIGEIEINNWVVLY